MYNNNEPFTKSQEIYLYNEPNDFGKLNGFDCSFAENMKEKSEEKEWLRFGYSSYGQPSYSGFNTLERIYI